MKPNGIAVAGVLALVAILGAAQTIDPKERHPYLDVSIKNLTKELLYDSAFAFGKSEFEAGALSPGGTKRYLDWEGPVGTNAVVRWRDSKQGRKERTISVSEVYDRTAPGELIFSITTSNVMVKFEIKKQ